MDSINFKISNQTPFYKHHYHKRTHQPRTSEVTINKISITNNSNKGKDSYDDFFPLLYAPYVKEHDSTYNIVEFTPK